MIRAGTLNWTRRNRIDGHHQGVGGREKEGVWRVFPEHRPAEPKAAATVAPLVLTTNVAAASCRSSQSKYFTVESTLQAALPSCRMLTGAWEGFGGDTQVPISGAQKQVLTQRDSWLPWRSRKTNTYLRTAVEMSEGGNPDDHMTRQKLR